MKLKLVSPDWNGGPNLHISSSQSNLHPGGHDEYYPVRATGGHLQAYFTFSLN